MRLSERGKCREFLASQNPDWLDHLSGDFPTFAHGHQSEPLVSQAGLPWRTWLILGGRGAGKTRAGAEWVRALAQGDEEKGIKPVSPIALVGETEHDAREVMVEGVSGLLGLHAHDRRPIWISSRRRLEWPTGAYAQAFSAEDPESLRGPQFAAAWCDELAKWRHPLDDRPAQAIAAPGDGGPHGVPAGRLLIHVHSCRWPTATVGANSRLSGAISPKTIPPYYSPSLLPLSPRNPLRSILRSPDATCNCIRS